MDNRRFLIIPALILLAGLLPGCPAPGGETPTQADRSTRISQDDRALIREKVGQVTDPVTIHFYSRGDQDKGVKNTRKLLGLIDQASGMVSVEEHNIQAQPQGAQPPGITRGPVMVMEGKEAYGMRYDGYPTRLELAPFLDSILIASGKVPPLMDRSRASLENLDQDVVIKVFVTPDWKYCPESVRLAYTLAASSEKVTAHVIGTHEFPEEGEKYDVVVVPKTWVNDRVFLEGIAPTAEMNEMAYILMIRQALDMSIPPGKFRVPKKFFSSPED